MLSVALNVVIVVILLWTVCVGCGDQSVVTLSTSSTLFAQTFQAKNRVVFSFAAQNCLGIFSSASTLLNSLSSRSIMHTQGHSVCFKACS